MSHRAYFFGCWRDTGHYFWWPGNRSTPYKEYGGSRPEHIVPWGWGVDSSKLYPRRQSEALLHHKDGWTMLAVTDNTVDPRPGSHSAFLFEDDLTFDRALAEARKLFGAVVERIEKAAAIREVARDAY